MKNLKNYIPKINKLCKHHHVKTLYVIGSVLEERFDENSDIDLMVDFETIKLENYADNYFDFKFSLQSILNRSIDLLEEKAIKNPYLLQAINTKKQLLYGC